MRTAIKELKTKSFKIISYDDSGEEGRFFKIVDMDKHLKEANEPPYINAGDVLMTLDNQYLQDYDKGELVLNLTKSKITFVPFEAIVIELEQKNIVEFTDVLNDEFEKGV